MPLLETPSNPASPPPPPKPDQPVKFTTRRFGEIQEHELLHLLDSIDDEIARARFRESIYVSIIVCLALAWLAAYGPRYLFHQGAIANPKEEVAKIDDRDLRSITTPKAIIHKLPPVPHSTPRPAPAPAPPAPATQHAAPAAERPLPPAPQPQPRPATPTPLPPAPQPPPRPTQASNIPDAPHPPAAVTASKPNFDTSANARNSLKDAIAAAARAGGSGNAGASSAPGRNGAGMDGVQILSDTLGTDFGPYIKRLLRILRASWYPLIPEETMPPLNKEGWTLIRFTINSDGSLAVGGMHLDASTHDQAIDRAAWGSITGVGQFPPLPSTFKGPNLELRIDFIISHNPPRDE